MYSTARAVLFQMVCSFPFYYNPLLRIKAQFAEAFIQQAECLPLLFLGLGTERENHAPKELRALNHQNRDLIFPPVNRGRQQRMQQSHKFTSPLRKRAYPPLLQGSGGLLPDRQNQRPRRVESQPMGQIICYIGPASEQKPRGASIRPMVLLENKQDIDFYKRLRYYM